MTLQPDDNSNRFQCMRNLTILQTNKCDSIWWKWKSYNEQNDG